MFTQNCPSQAYIQIYFGALFDLSRSFCFNGKKVQNIRDTEKMLRNKIVYFKKIYNFGLKYFFIGVISCVYPLDLLSRFFSSLSTNCKNDR